jgi:hypothetical protein
MTRRKMMLIVVLGATAVGLANFVGFANHNAGFTSDDEGQAALIKAFGVARINWQQHLVVTDHVTSKVAKVGPITASADLVAANAQSAAMAKAKTSLKAAIGEAVSQLTGFRAVVMAEAVRYEPA